MSQSLIKKKKSKISESVCSSMREPGGPTSYLYIQVSFTVFMSIIASKNPPNSAFFPQMQLCQKESLREWLKRSTSRDYNKVLNFFEQIVQAVEYVHLNGLIHRDLKVRLLILNTMLYFKTFLNACI